MDTISIVISRAEMKKLLMPIAATVFAAAGVVGCGEKNTGAAEKKAADAAGCFDRCHEV